MSGNRKKSRRKSRKKFLLAVLFSIVLMELLFLILIIKIYIPRQKEINTDLPENNIIEDNSGTVTNIAPLFVGDSRTVGMSEAVPGIDVHAKNGSTYYYLTSLDDRIRSSGSDCVVICFGVNDLKDIKEYTEYANKLGRELDKNLYFLTVNPVDENKELYNGYNVKNNAIKNFNVELIKSAESYRVIDTNSYLMDVGFETVDGLHYDENTYIKLYNYIMKELERLER